jgi:hypothetical protein
LGEGWYRAAIVVGKVVLKGLDVTTRASGQEHVPRQSPVDRQAAAVAACALGSSGW